MMGTRFSATAVALLALLVVAPAQSNLATANWELANRFVSSYVQQYVYSTSLSPGWINGTDEFWYSWRSSDGVRFWRVDPAKRSKQPLFDSDEMAAKLSELTRKPYDRSNLNIQNLSFVEDSTTVIRFVLDQVRFEYDLEKGTLKSLGAVPQNQGQGGGPGGGRFGGGQGGQGQGGQRNQEDTPTSRPFGNYNEEKTAYVYAKDHNLYYVEIVDGKEADPIQLSTDGELSYSFGSRRGQGENYELRQQENETQQGGGQGNNRPPEDRVRANVTWSKDGKRFYVVRGDARKVADLWLVNNLATPRPTLVTYRYAMPGEANVTQSELHCFDPASKKLVKLPVEKYKDQQFFDLHWQDTSSESFRFIRRDRLQRNMELCEINLADNKVKVLLTESVENAFLERRPVRYLKPGGDFIWWSERTGWGHLYLYANDGTLKKAITSGPFRVESLTDYDEKAERLYFECEGREPGENPYYQHLYRVDLDGKNLNILDPGDADNNTSLSPSKKFAVVVSGRTDMAPVATVRNDRGEIIMELETADLTRLAETGWKMPETFRVKAADGVTDIYGNMWKPFDFDPRKKYPIIANVYPGPQTESVSTGFSAYTSNMRLAQLGFVVIQIGNRGGNPARSNAYHSYGYYNLRDYGLADKKAGIEQLAARNPFIDINRVGIYGHSGGGFMTAAAMMLPPYNDFFKVGVSSAGNHDNNVYNSNWSEQHHGLREVAANEGQGQGRGSNTGRTAPDDWSVEDEPQDAGTRFEIKVPTNAELAANLKGHILLVHGDMDNNVHPANTIRLVDALIKANKRFDMLMMPGQAHGFGPMQGYFQQRLMEYFAQYLLDAPSPTSVDMSNP
ncbi:MAG: S9 family peptidase [Fimbriimonadaceae bacterium]|nr:S9 family peptidase [Fimbriimonadaceae bacterium]